MHGHLQSQAKTEIAWTDRRDMAATSKCFQLRVTDLWPAHKQQSEELLMTSRNLFDSLSQTTDFLVIF